jgi:hypothetical protein
MQFFEISDVVEVDAFGTQGNCFCSLEAFYSSSMAMVLLASPNIDNAPADSPLGYKEAVCRLVLGGQWLLLLARCAKLVVVELAVWRLLWSARFVAVVVDHSTLHNAQADNICLDHKRCLQVQDAR